MAETDYAIEVEGLKKRLGSKQVLADVSLRVARGATFAFLGRNGQGKTTTIRTLLGLLPPDGGRLAVERRDPTRDAMAIRQHVGYLAEDQRTFEWMTVAETLRFVRPFYAAWDGALADRLLRDFDLPPKTKVKQLSKGQNVRLGLLLALAHRPRLVILDDPTLGLDPIMRKEFMRDVIDHLQGEGVTVFFSSHLLYEIEAVADEVAILDGGRIVRQAATEDLRADVRQFVVAAEAAARLGTVKGLLDEKSSERRVALVAEGADALRGELARGGVAFEEAELNLDEIFEAYVIGNRGKKVK